jgi:hypothetical protein
LKIHRDNGAIEFSSGVIAPTMSRAQFLSSPIGRSSRKSLANAQWQQFAIEPEPDIGATVLFDGEAIERVIVAIRLPSEKTGNDWNERVEHDRKRHHDAWLSAHLGEPPYQYAWGQVESEYDSKGCASAIIIAYDR